MDFSALIFLALAVAWAAYLIPKALRHQEEVRRSRSVEVFSDSMRVLARRDAVSRRDAELVVPSSEAPRTASFGADLEQGEGGELPESLSLGQQRRLAANKSARRRRNVLTGLLVLLLTVVGLAAGSVVSWWWVGAPSALVVAWLVACRLLVKRERSVRVPSARPESRTAATPIDAEPAHGDEELSSAYALAAEVDDDTQPALPVIDEELDDDPSRWDMIPVTLPTYVSKPVATRRTVHTIDLDSTGVWSSGRSEIDSAIAREAEESQRQARQAQSGEETRAQASGS